MSLKDLTRLELLISFICVYLILLTGFLGIIVLRVDGSRVDGGGGDGSRAGWSRAGWFGRVSFSVLPVFVRVAASFSTLIAFLRYSLM